MWFASKLTLLPGSELNLKVVKDKIYQSKKEILHELAKVLPNLHKGLEDMRAELTQGFARVDSEHSAQAAQLQATLALLEQNKAEMMELQREMGSGAAKQDALAEGQAQLMAHMAALGEQLSNQKAALELEIQTATDPSRLRELRDMLVRVQTQQEEMQANMSKEFEALRDELKEVVKVLRADLSVSAERMRGDLTAILKKAQHDADHSGGNAELKARMDKLIRKVTKVQAGLAETNASLKEVKEDVKDVKFSLEGMKNTLAMTRELVADSLEDVRTGRVEIAALQKTVDDIVSFDCCCRV